MSEILLDNILKTCQEYFSNDHPGFKPLRPYVAFADMNAFFTIISGCIEVFLSP